MPHVCFPCFYTFVAVICLQLLCHVNVEARPRTSMELIEGDWNLKVGIWCQTPRQQPCVVDNDDHAWLLFPLQTTIDEHQKDKENDAIQFTPTRKFRILPAWFRQRRRLTLACRLSVYPNGTFVLQPKQQDDVVSLLESSSSTPESLVSSSSQHHHQRQERLTIHGTWNILSNPYCATDRFYDQVHFHSYPRVQKLVHVTQYLPFQQKRKNDPGRMVETDEEILNRIQLHLHCRLYGHFAKLSRPSWRRSSRTQPPHSKETRAIRLTHGTILCEPLLVKSSSSSSSSPSSRLRDTSSRRHPRTVLASFSAVKCLKAPFSSSMTLGKKP